MYEVRHPYHQARTVIDEDDERYWCADCGLKTGAQFRLNKHLEKRGPLLAKFECPECSAWWTSAHAYCQNYQPTYEAHSRPASSVSYDYYSQSTSSSSARTSSHIADQPQDTSGSFCILF